MKKIEITLGVSLIALFILNIFIEIPIMLLILLGLVYSGFYLIFSIFLLNKLSLKEGLKSRAINEYKRSRIFFSIFSGLVFSLSVVSILFKVLKWPGTIFLMAYSIIGLIIVFIISLKQKSKKKGKSFLYRNIITRVSVLFVIILFFFVKTILNIS